MIIFRRFNTTALTEMICIGVNRLKSPIAGHTTEVKHPVSPYKIYNGIKFN